MFPVLLGTHGDAPFTAKLACACGHSAKKGCHRCCILGTRQADTADGPGTGDRLNSVAFGGVAFPTEAQTFGPDGRMQPADPMSYQTEDGRYDKDAASHIRRAHEDSVALGELAERITEEEREHFVAAVALIGATDADEPAKAAGASACSYTVDDCRKG